MSANDSRHESSANPPVDVAFTDDDDETGLLPAVAAATVLIFHERDERDTRPRLLMVRRAKTMAFAAGAAVFPGGKLDADDHEVAKPLALGAGMALADAAARVAAIRETLEETGLAPGLEHGGGDAALAAMRVALLADMPFSVVLAEHGARLILDELVPFSRWRPNFAHARIFDTRFYLARLAGPLPHHGVDESENSELFWIGAAEAVAQAQAGALHMIFPTRRNMERVAQYRSFDEARDSTRRFPPRRITPFIKQHNGQPHLCIRDDCGYPITSERLDKAIRD
ncbi:MAG: NUDIX domain-containing protein [Sphingopyxis sp.]